MAEDRMVDEVLFPKVDVITDDEFRVGVLISGSGTNLQALIDACASGEIDGRVVVVISNKHDAFGLERARRAGVATEFVDRAAYNTISAYNHAITEILERYEVKLVVMAGYMRLLGQEVLSAFEGRVMNLHPALLPAFPGASAIHDAFEHGVKVTGVTVHFADEHFDRGPIVLQEPVRVDEDDTVATLETKIHAVEHRLIVEAVRLFSVERLVIDGRKVRILPE
ncbi:MAG: phosphoribosylglycinamide formyltransferase [Coriobacteriia bacterium]